MTAEKKTGHPQSLLMQIPPQLDIITFTSPKQDKQPTLKNKTQKKQLQSTNLEDIEGLDHFFHHFKTHTKY